MKNKMYPKPKGSMSAVQGIKKSGGLSFATRRKCKNTIPTKYPKLIFETRGVPSDGNKINDIY